MPLIDLSGEEAFATWKNNRVAMWGDRASANRLDPVAMPEFDAPFRIAPGEAIFTVGSCFARNIEDELARRGHRIPVRDLLQSAVFQGVSPIVLNNYAAPSIYNEFAWAFEERPFKHEDHILEIAPGRFVDLHFSENLAPAAWDVAVARRQAVARMYRAVAECRVIVMTLGLAENWFDSQTGHYLNIAPRGEIVRLHPGRFRLHVLSFEETFNWIDLSLKLLKKKCGDFRVLLTVSPVPLTATFRNQDVILANCYSKSVLRTVAETAAAAHDFVTYFPSYESVLHSDRRQAFLNDYIHVSDDLIQVNVARMLDAFVGEQPPAEEFSAAGMALYYARRANARGGRIAKDFFRKHRAWSGRYPPFAIEHARFYRTRRNYAKALSMLRHAPGLSGSALEMECLILSGATTKALELLDRIAPQAYLARSLWETALAAAMEVGEVDCVLQIFAGYLKSKKKFAFRAGARVAEFLSERGRHSDALALYKKVNKHLPSPQSRAALKRMAKLQGPARP